MRVNSLPKEITCRDQDSNPSCLACEPDALTTRPPRLTMNYWLMHVLPIYMNSFNSVLYFINRFKCLMVDLTPKMMDKLQLEFVKYQTDTLPQYIVSECRIDIA